MNLVNPALTLPKAANSSVSPDSFTPVQTQTTPAAAPTDQADFKRQKQELLGQILEMQRFMANLAIEQPEHWINWGIAKLRGKKTSKELLEKGALRLDQLSSQLAVGGIGLSEARQKFRAILRENNIPFSEAVEAESNVFENLAFVAETVDKLSDQGVQEILEYKFGSEVAFFGSGAYRALKLILREYLTVKNESDCPSDDKAIWQKAFDRIMQNGTWKPAFQATAQDYLQRKFSRSVPKEVGEVLQSGVLYFGTDLMSQVMSNLLYEKPPFENLDAKSLGLSFVIGLAGGVLGKQLDKTNLSDIHKLLIEAGYDGLSAVFQEIILQLDDGVPLKEIFTKDLLQQFLLEATGGRWTMRTNSIKNNQENNIKEENNNTTEEQTQGKTTDNRQEIQRVLVEVIRNKVYKSVNFGRLEDYISQVQNLIKTYENQGKKISIKQAVAKVLSVEQTSKTDTGLQMNLDENFKKIPPEDISSVHEAVLEADFSNKVYDFTKGQLIDTDTTRLFPNVVFRPLDLNNIQTDQLVYVHMTDYLPHNNKILSANKANNTSRYTIHTSINHVVASHSSGNWSDKNYAIIMPANITHLLSGKPVAGVEVDAFWNHEINIASEKVVLLVKDSSVPKNKFKVLSPEEVGLSPESKLTILATSEPPHSMANLVVKKMGYTALEEAGPMAINEPDLSFNTLPIKFRSINSKTIEYRKAFGEYFKSENIEQYFHSYSPWMQIEAGIWALKELENNIAQNLKEFFKENPKLSIQEKARLILHQRRRLEKHNPNSQNNIWHSKVWKDAWFNTEERANAKGLLANWVEDLCKEANLRNIQLPIDTKQLLKIIRSSITPQDAAFLVKQHFDIDLNKQPMDLFGLSKQIYSLSDYMNFKKALKSYWLKDQPITKENLEKLADVMVKSLANILEVPPKAAIGSLLVNELHERDLYTPEFLDPNFQPSQKLIQFCQQLNIPIQEVLDNIRLAADYKLEEFPDRRRRSYNVALEFLNDLVNGQSHVQACKPDLFRALNKYYKGEESLDEDDQAIINFFLNQYSKVEGAMSNDDKDILNSFLNTNSASNSFEDRTNKLIKIMQKVFKVIQSEKDPTKKQDLYSTIFPSAGLNMQTLEEKLLLRWKFLGSAQSKEINSIPSDLDIQASLGSNTRFIIDQYTQGEINTNHNYEVESKKVVKQAVDLIQAGKSYKEVLDFLAIERRVFAEDDAFGKMRITNGASTPVRIGGERYENYLPLALKLLERVNNRQTLEDFIEQNNRSFAK